MSELSNELSLEILFTDADVFAESFHKAPKRNRFGNGNF